MKQLLMILLVVLPPATLVSAGQDGALPGLLFETDRTTGRMSERESPLWVASDKAVGADGLFDVSIFGQFVPRNALAQLENPDGVRGVDGVCRYTKSLSGGPAEFGSYAAFARDSRYLILGEVVSRQTGFLFGRPATFYGVLVDDVLRSKGAWKPLGRVVYVPHMSVSIDIGGAEICYRGDSYPMRPDVGGRAAVRMDGRPIILTDGQGARYHFAGSFLEGRFWFETDSKRAYISGMERIVDPPRWRAVERQLASVVDSIS